MAFDPSLLAYFRRRLARSMRPNRVFEAVREGVWATGVLKGKHRRALDSTVLDDVVATQDTVNQHRDELLVRRGRRHRTTSGLLHGLGPDRRLAHLASLP
jgi:hypothetical protein